MIGNQTPHVRNRASSFPAVLRWDLAAFFWPARLQAGGVAAELSGRQQSHPLNRDEEGE
jgi:hypothetical protein